MTKFKKGDCVRVVKEPLYHLIRRRKYTVSTREVSIGDVGVVESVNEDGDCQIGKALVNSSCLEYANAEVQSEPDLPNTWVIQCSTYEQMLVATAALEAHGCKWHDSEPPTRQRYKQCKGEACLRVTSVKEIKFGGKNFYEMRGNLIEPYGDGLLRICRFSKEAKKVLFGYTYGAEINALRGAVPGAGCGIREKIRETAYMEYVKPVVGWQPAPVEDCGHREFRTITQGKQAGKVRCLTPGCEQHYQVTTGGLRRPRSRDYPLGYRYAPTLASRLIRGPSLAMAKEMWGDEGAKMYTRGLLLVAEDNPTYYVQVKPIETPKGWW